jgi:pantoate--beta-alanine ligase
MISIRTPSEMQAWARRQAVRGRTVGLVPTMGCLHEGHLALVRACREAADATVVSLFVNPTQFGPAEDFARYPREPERDREHCEREGVEVLFAPDAADMYPEGYSVYVEETRLSRGLCGASRPGHFRGVATVVTKLFNAVGADLAFFGQKDAQQARVIQQLVRDLNLPVRIVIVPTVREADGLAMSSRNAYLSAAQRRAAPRLYGALLEARARFAGGERSAQALCRCVLACLEGVEELGVEYVELVDWDRLEPVRAIEDRALLALAARLGTTRLIDNIMLDPCAADGAPPCCAPRSGP